MQRSDGREANQIRPTEIQSNYLVHPDGSVLISVGDTKVICSAFVEDRVPMFLRGQGQGWISAEYSMIPGSTETRKARDRSRGVPDGRSVEIQRLIGRALRSVVDLEALGEKTIWVDCDVIQADGGTRTASITGSFVALKEAINKLIESGELETNPIKEYVAAVSVGIPSDGEEPVLDLYYPEDKGAQVDMNVVMTEGGDLIEVQGTGEERPFTKKEMEEMMALAEKGINELIAIQKNVLKKSEEAAQKALAPSEEENESGSGEKDEQSEEISDSEDTSESKESGEA